MPLPNAFARHRWSFADVCPADSSDYPGHSADHGAAQKKFRYRIRNRPMAATAQIG
jgi:hypothetical protein